jgi:[acyl-carrier-protein] S-malonyltransferase
VAPVILASMLEQTHAGALGALFPGQGSSVSNCRAIIERHCARLHSDAVKLLGGDPLERAVQGTRYAQPAIFLASLAGWRATRQACAEPSAFAGHSLGEITALTAAGIFAADDALELVVLRARLMDEAVTDGPPGGMVAILKGTVEQAERVALRNGLHVANYNAPGQTVLSGPLDALDAAGHDARSLGLGVLKLGVSGPFHSPSLSRAREPFFRAISTLALNAAPAPVLSSLTAEPFTEPARELADALTAPVRWSETMLALDRLGIDAYLDVGPDRVLERLAKRNLNSIQLIDRESLGVFA